MTISRGSSFNRSWVIVNVSVVCSDFHFLNLNRFLTTEGWLKIGAEFISSRVQTFCGSNTKVSQLSTWLSAKYWFYILWQLEVFLKLCCSRKVSLAYKICLFSMVLSQKSQHCKYITESFEVSLPYHIPYCTIRRCTINPCEPSASALQKNSYTSFVRFSFVHHPVVRSRSRPTHHGSHTFPEAQGWGLWASRPSSCLHRQLLQSCFRQGLQGRQTR